MYKCFLFNWFLFDRFVSLLPTRAQPQAAPPLASASTATTVGACPPLQALGTPPPLSSLPSQKAPLSSYAATVKGGPAEAACLSEPAGKCADCLLLFDFVVDRFLESHLQSEIDRVPPLPARRVREQRIRLDDSSEFPPMTHEAQ